MSSKLTGVLLVMGLFVYLVSCKRDEPENPYDVEVPIEIEEVVVNNLPQGNFAWLHAKVFTTTCANSGCHDGSFEPHFSTISSSYNTLVNHPVIANDAQFSFEHRVVPGNVDASMLYERLTNEIPNTSGMMPLVVDPGSDWPDRKVEYLAAIAAWINAGAPDMYGNMPGDSDGDFPPQVEGLLVFPPGNTSDPYERDPESVSITPIIVPAGEVDLWVAVTDDNTAPQSMGVNELRMSTELGDVDDAIANVFVTTSSINAPGFGGTSVTFYHRVTVNLSSYASGTTLFLRTYFDDGAQSNVTAIPNEGSNSVITSLFTLQIQ